MDWVTGWLWEGILSGETGNRLVSGSVKELTPYHRRNCLKSPCLEPKWLKVGHQDLSWKRNLTMWPTLLFLNTSISSSPWTKSYSSPESHAGCEPDVFLTVHSVCHKPFPCFLLESKMLIFLYLIEEVVCLPRKRSHAFVSLWGRKVLKSGFLKYWFPGRISGHSGSVCLR